MIGGKPLEFLHPGELVECVGKEVGWLDYWFQYSVGKQDGICYSVYVPHLDRSIALRCCSRPRSCGG